MAQGLYAVVTVAEVETLVGLSASGEETRYERLIDAATAQMERATGTIFIRRQWTESHTGGPGYVRGGNRTISLDRGPLTTVLSIVDDQGGSVPATDYEVSGPEAQLVHHHRWPAPRYAWHLTVSGGWFDEVADVDADVKLAAALLVEGLTSQTGAGGSDVQNIKVGDLSLSYGSRDPQRATGELPPRVADLLAPYRRHGV